MKYIILLLGALVACNNQTQNKEEAKSPCDVTESSEINKEQAEVPVPPPPSAEEGAE